VSLHRPDKVKQRAVNEKRQKHRQVIAHDRLHLCRELVATGRLASRFKAQTRATLKLFRE
jgi:hypothetical protein